ncbi:MAG: hypothetical protein ABFR89_00660 [Actinomycetota bacterium]
MNERDQELIVDLIDGRLSPQEERAALARLETDTELRAEYETQQMAASLLAEAPVPSMTADERSRLRAALKSELHLAPVVAPVAARPSKWRRWVAPIGSLAAAAAVLAGVFVVLPQSSSDTAQVAFDATTMAASAETTTAQNRDRGAETDTERLAEAPTAGGMDAPAEEPEEPTLDAAEPPAETFSASRSIPHVPAITLEEIAADVSALTKASESDEAGAEDGAAQDALVADCLTVLRDNASFVSVEPMATTTIGTSDALVVEVTPIEGELYYAAYAIDTCSELQNTKP